MTDKEKELLQQLGEERMVKKSETQMNLDLKDRIAKLELHQETLLKINDEFSNKIAKYRNIIKRLTD